MSQTLFIGSIVSHGLFCINGLSDSFAAHARWIGELGFERGNRAMQAALTRWQGSLLRKQSLG